MLRHYKETLASLAGRAEARPLQGENLVSDCDPGLGSANDAEPSWAIFSRPPDSVRVLGLKVQAKRKNVDGGPRYVGTGSPHLLKKMLGEENAKSPL